MFVTQHAKIRIKERCGLPKRAIERSASVALREGVSHKETTGRLKKYIDWLFLSYGHGGKIKLYNNHAYIFTNSEVLITVIPIPSEHRNSVKKINDRKKLCDDNKK